MFKTTVYNHIGTTGDDNDYPILLNKEGVDFSERYKVAMPIGEYNDVIKHFDSIDDKLAEVEEKLGIENKENILQNWWDDLTWQKMIDLKKKCNIQTMSVASMDDKRVMFEYDQRMERVSKWWNLLSYSEVLRLKSECNIPEGLATQGQKSIMYSYSQKPSFIEQLYKNRRYSSGSKDMPQWYKDYSQIPENKYNDNSSGNLLQYIPKEAVNEMINNVDVPQWGLSYRPIAKTVLMSQTMLDTLREQYEEKIRLEMRQKLKASMAKVNSQMLLKTNPYIPSGYGVYIGDNNDVNSFGDLFSGIGCAMVNWTAPELRLPKHVDIYSKEEAGYIMLKTWIHTVIDGVHEEQECTMQRWVGYEPIRMTRPDEVDIMEMTSKEISDYSDTVIEWRQREDEYSAYLTSYSRGLQTVYTQLLTSVEKCIENGRLSILGQASNNYKMRMVDINPWAYWVSPKMGVPDKYKNLIKTPRQQAGMCGAFSGGA